MADIKLNATQKRAMAEMAKGGFTFCGDAIFTTFNQGKRCLQSLARLTLAEPITSEYGTEYVLTDTGRHFQKWGFLED